MAEPFLCRPVFFCALLYFIRSLHQLLHRNLMTYGVFPEEAVISHPLADILDCRIRSLVPEHFHIPLKLVDPVNHPCLVTVKIPQRFITYFSLHAVPAKITLRAVGDSQQISALAPLLRQMEITHQIYPDKMVVQAVDFLLHNKRNLPFCQRLRQSPCIQTRAVQNCHFLIGDSLVPVLPDRLKDIIPLCRRVAYLLDMNRLSFSLL